MKRTRIARSGKVIKRPIVPKTEGRKDQKLRDSAKSCPHCMRCGLGNPNGDLLCLAHSNQLSDGKGRGFKSVDSAGAILCAACHAFVDGAGPNRETMQGAHLIAHERTVIWWKWKGLI